MKTSKTFLSICSALIFALVMISAQKDTQDPVTKTLDLENFTSIGLGIAADVVLTQGSKQSVTVTGQARDIEDLNTKIHKGVWRIKSTQKNYRHKKMTIHVTMKTLHSLSIGGSGSIKGTNKFTNLKNLELSIGGSGNIELEFDANDVECSIGGSGTMDLEGSCNEAEISLSGSGDVNAFKLQTKTCEVSTAGSGDVDISVSDHLEVSSVGSGDVSYIGDPRIESSSVGSGKVRKKGSM